MGNIVDQLLLLSSKLSLARSTRLIERKYLIGLVIYSANKFKISVVRWVACAVPYLPSVATDQTGGVVVLLVLWALLTLCRIGRSQTCMDDQTIRLTSRDTGKVRDFIRDPSRYGDLKFLCTMNRKAYEVLSFYQPRRPRNVEVTTEQEKLIDKCCPSTLRHGIPWRSCSYRCDSSAS